MSRESVELVRDFLDAYNRGDLDAAFDLFAADIESTGYAGETTTGREHAREAFLAWREDWEWFTSHLEEFIDLDDGRAVVVCRNKGRGRRSGVQVDMLAGEVWGFRGGQIASLVLYRTREEALEAVGLRESDSLSAE